MKIADFRFDAIPAAAAAPVLEAAPAGTLAGRFAEAARRFPARTAIRDAAGSWSYAELDARSNRVARFVRELGLGSEAPVALLFDRRREFLAAALGVLKAGACYVPIDPALPRERQRRLIDTVSARLLIGVRATAGALHRLQWRCPSLDHILCLDADDLDALTEMPGSLMSAELWEHLAGDAADDVLAGGWKSAFSGRPLPEAALAAFGANASRKTAPLLVPGARVLEVGCASGFTMRHVAPAAGSYVATDIARRNVERALTAAKASGLGHVIGRPLAAHDIDVFEPGSFDLIVLNSVVESFPGFGYLRAVLDKAARLLAPGGAIFLGNIWDLDRRDAYLADLAAYARAHAGDGVRTRLDPADDLFVPRAFLADWAVEQGAALEVSALNAPGFEPAAYTFDAVLRPDAGIDTDPSKRRHDARALDRHSTAQLDEEPSPGQAAYVIFTSGTAGRPRGALIEHRSVVNLADAVAAELFAPLGAEEGLSISALANFAFDASVVQLFPALLGGHTIQLPDDDTRRDPARLHDFLTSRAVDLCDLTPSQFGLLIDHWRAHGTATGVRTFVLGGEAVSETLLRRFYEEPRHRDTRVVNAYGPTEACVCATIHPMTATGWAERLPPPIGRPLPGVRVQVCDRSGTPLPPGVPGEIRIGGAGVARGYVGDAEATAAKFVTAADGRWYRSGDLGRWTDDGLLQFLGREDRQVKIRGNRIELGEIETVLAAFPNVRQSAVVARDGALAAYVVALPGFEPGACKAALEAALPGPMVPQWLTGIEALPLTINGKLDEARLPPPDVPMTSAGRPPATETERRLAAVWREVLERPVDDAEADFFALGGHSVLAVRLVSEIERSFGRRLPLSELFARPTVAALAQRLDAAEAVPHDPVVAINAGGNGVPIVCFHPVGGNVLCYKGLADALGPDQPVYMVESQGLQEGEALLPTVEEMAGTYLAALRRTLPDGPVIMAGWSFGGLIAYEAAARLQKNGADVRAVMVFDAIANPESIRALLRQDESDFLAALFGELNMVKAEELRGLSPEARLDLLIERGRGGDLFPDGIDRDGMRRLLGVFQNNALACVRYRPPPIEGPLLLVRPLMPSSQAPGVPGDDYNGWRALPAGGVRLRWMDGTHGQMLEEPYVRQLAAHVREHLASL
jgi:amino acid adenylation domain-containing protein